MKVQEKARKNIVAASDKQNRQYDIKAHSTHTKLVTPYSYIAICLF